MSLMRPTAGEMLDRLAILHLKIARGEEGGADVKHFREEFAEVQEELLGRWDGRKHQGRFEELLDVHEAIWPLIETSPPELLRLNARRVAIREEIDKATGEYRGPEKV